MSERLTALRKLQENPHDVEAMKTIFNAQKQVRHRYSNTNTGLQLISHKCNIKSEIRVLGICVCAADGQLGTVEAAARSVHRVNRG